jgi:hypothetical protein
VQQGVHREAQVSVKEDLIAARALISTPERWIKQAFVVLDTRTNTECYCLDGAIQQVCGTLQKCVDDELFVRRNRCAGLIYKVLDARGVTYGIWEFNDRPETEHADVLAVLDAAIELAE